MKHAIYLTAALVIASPACAQPELEKGFAGALRGCEQWVLNPASWSSGPGPFMSTVGLGDKMGLVNKVEDVNLPPVELQRGNHYWRINSTLSAGYVLVVSDQMPMCHITGGGDADLKPTIEAVLASPLVARRWERQTSSIKGDMHSTRFRSRQDPALSILISRATKPRQRLDRVQVIATATYEQKK